MGWESVKIWRVRCDEDGCQRSLEYEPGDEYRDSYGTRFRITNRDHAVRAFRLQGWVIGQRGRTHASALCPTHSGKR